MLSVLIVHSRPEPALALTLSRLVEGALAAMLADVALLDLCADPLAAALAEESGCALKRPAGDPSAALAQSVGQARAEWLLLGASGLALAPGWAQAARETMALADGGAQGLAGTFFAAPRRGIFARLRGADGFVLARRAGLAGARLSLDAPGRAGAQAARRTGRLRRLEGLCQDERQ